MQRLILALTFAAAIALFTSGPAYASCSTSTVTYGGRMVTCTTCCIGSYCNTNCF